MGAILDMVRSAHANPAAVAGAETAFKLFRSWAPGLGKATRIPGMGTQTRLAIRIDRGRTVEQAAAREYLYRWNQVFQSLEGHGGITKQWWGARTYREPIWGIPHPLGM